MEFVKKYWGYLFIIPLIVFGFLVYAPVFVKTFYWEPNNGGTLHLWLVVPLDMVLLWYLLFYILKSIFRTDEENVLLMNIWKAISSLLLITLIYIFPLAIGYSLIIWEKFTNWFAGDLW
jgi:hypothetical protein